MGVLGALTRRRRRFRRRDRGDGKDECKGDRDVKDDVQEGNLASFGDDERRHSLAESDSEHERKSDDSWS